MDSTPLQPKDYLVWNEIGGISLKSQDLFLVLAYLEDTNGLTMEQLNCPCDIRLETC